MPHGVLEVIVANAQNLRDVEVFGKMDPFVELLLDTQRFRTKTAKNGSKAPAFNETFRFNVIDGCTQLRLDAWDEDTVSNDHIGSCLIPLDVAFAKGLHDAWFDIFTPHKHKPAGKVHLCMSFTPRTAVQQPGQQPAAPAHHVPPAQPQQQYPGYAPVAPPGGMVPGYVPVAMVGYPAGAPPAGYPGYAPAPPVAAYPGYPPQQQPQAQPGYPMYAPQMPAPGYPPQMPPQMPAYGAPPAPYPIEAAKMGGYPPQQQQQGFYPSQMPGAAYPAYPQQPPYPGR
ncbi:hypothetical protein H9P43_008484 [Blastocladiella emersonii ATCC 22665]|nr:hypothetical protein H9P43_008484 [Blastocladiella emersonii ATCC 22665]